MSNICWPQVGFVVEMFSTNFLLVWIASCVRSHKDEVICPPHTRILLSLLSILAVTFRVFLLLLLLFTTVPATQWCLIYNFCELKIISIKWFLSSVTLFSYISFLYCSLSSRAISFLLPPTFLCSALLLESWIPFSSFCLPLPASQSLCPSIHDCRLRLCGTIAFPFRTFAAFFLPLHLVLATIAVVSLITFTESGDALPIQFMAIL